VANRYESIPKIPKKNFHQQKQVDLRPTMGMISTRAAINMRPRPVPIPKVGYSYNV
jgi:hypothetical protein